TVLKELQKVGRSSADKRHYPRWDHGGGKLASGYSASRYFGGGPNSETCPGRSCSIFGDCQTSSQSIALPTPQNPPSTRTTDEPRLRGGGPRSRTLTEGMSWALWRMSASLIGRLGSSAFRLSNVAVSMSLAGSRFSSDSALRPFQHGVRRRGGTIFRSALPSDWR